MIECTDCVAYRHILKDVLRGDPTQYALTAMKGLNEEAMSPLGKLMHKLVKAAVQWRYNAGPEAESALGVAVDDLVKDAGPTVVGWVENAKELT